MTATIPSSHQVIAFSTSGVLAAPADAFSMKRMAKAGLAQEDAALKLGLEARVAKLRAELDEARVKVDEERTKCGIILRMLMLCLLCHGM